MADSIEQRSGQHTDHHVGTYSGWGGGCVTLWQKCDAHVIRPTHPLSVVGAALLEALLIQAVGVIIV
jgi:hypothetical protein